MLDPQLYSDRNLPPWLRHSAGHEPVKSPSLMEAAAEKDATTTATAAADKRPKAMRGHQESQSPPGGLGLHIVVPSHDGHVYVIDGRKGCAERIDTGEHIYSMPLAEDVTGDGYLDLVLGTMNGQVMVGIISYHDYSHIIS